MSETSETPVNTEVGNTDEALGRQDGRTVSNDTFGDSDPGGAPLYPTTLDAAGVERIAGPPAAGFTPAPIEPSEEQVARMERHNAAEAERRGNRLNALTDTERLGETAQPLVQANRAYADELGGTGVTDVTPTDPNAGTTDPTTVPDPTVPSTPTDPTTTVGTTTSTPTSVESAATAAADADVARQVEDQRAAQADAAAIADEQALTAAEQAEVAREEGQA